MCAQEEEKYNPDTSIRFSSGVQESVYALRERERERERGGGGGQRGGERIKTKISSAQHGIYALGKEKAKKKKKKEQVNRQTHRQATRQGFDDYPIRLSPELSLVSIEYTSTFNSHPHPHPNQTYGSFTKIYFIRPT